MHRVPKYMGLYVGKDGIHTPYNGKFSKLYFMGHAGSYIEGNFQSFGPFAAGGISITKPAYFWTDWKERFEIAYDQNKVIELKAEEVDEQTSYSIGMWTKYFTAIPKRLLQKPDWLHLARLTINPNHKNYENLGDRTLALFIGRQYYGFFTYNSANNNPNIVQNIRYDDNFEGEWNFIYFSYNSELQLATGFVKFSKLDKIQRIQFRDIQHKPIDNYAKLVIGNEFQYQGFNGQIASLQLGFGKKFYVHDSDALNKIILEFFKPPGEDEDDNRKVNIVEEVKDRAFNNGPEYREILDQKGAEEYAMYGWFRYTSTTLKTPNNCIMRLTNNEQGYRGEISRVGDRTLLVMLQPGEYVFATYSLGNIDSGQIVNIRKPTPYKTNLGLWTYIYFGYHFQKRKASGIIKYPSGYALVPYDNVLHMVPNYLLFFFGGDGMLGGWHGQMQKVNLLFGRGSFVDSTKGNFAEKLPNLQGVESKPLIWDGIDNKIIEVPQPDRPALDIVFNKDVNGFVEYGYGLWTRWLTTIPKRIIEKAPFHQLIRLCSTEQYEDATQFGNRVLAIWVGKGYYHFTTYNKIGNKISTSQNINYDDNLEGEWNYIYYSFTNKQQARAVGFVYFSEQQGTAISRVEFLNLEHVALNGYARVVAANKEFGYQPFNGMIADLQIHLGNGFIGSREQLIKEIIQLNPKPSMSIQSKMDVNLINTEVIIKPEEKKEMKYKYEQYKGVNEYAVSGWLQSKVMGLTDAYRNVFRLTINPPEFQKDKQSAGDRTLSLFQSKTKLAFSTYTYGIFDTQGDDNNEFNRIINSGNSNGEWVFVYFGYQFKSKQAFAYTLFLNRQDSAQFNNIKHFVPNQFFFYLSNDGYYPIFDGSLFDWNLYFGEGAFTTKPKQIINQWPIEPIGEFEGVISALLSNQGLNSMKIIRPEKKEDEEVVFKNNFPKSGTISGNPAPRSGQTQVENKESKPISQTIVKQPQSGQIDSEKQQQQQQQQQQKQPRKPLSGIADQK